MDTPHDPVVPEPSTPPATPAPKPPRDPAVPETVREHRRRLSRELRASRKQAEEDGLFKLPDPPAQTAERREQLRWDVMANVFAGLILAWITLMAGGIFLLAVDAHRGGNSAPIRLLAVTVTVVPPAWAWVRTRKAGAMDIRGYGRWAERLTGDLAVFRPFVRCFPLILGMMVGLAAIIILEVSYWAMGDVLIRVAELMTGS